MSAYPRHAAADPALYRPALNDPPAWYGLPAEVRYCRRCVISNQRPNSAIEFAHTRAAKKATIRFDDDGVCDACRVAEAKAGIDWPARERELRALCDRHRRDDGRYDCIVPGSGGKDSFFAAHKLKYAYGMHPSQQASNSNPILISIHFKFPARPLGKKRYKLGTGPVKRLSIGQCDGRNNRNFTIRAVLKKNMLIYPL